MSDILAGKTEIEKGLRVVITNAQSLSLREDLKDPDEIRLALTMLQAALTLIERVK